MKIPQLLLTLCIALSSSTLLAGSDIDKLKNILTKRLPGVEVNKITKSPLDGLYEVISGSQIVYMSADGRYMIDGDFVDLVSKKNHTEDAKSGMRLAQIDALGEDNMLIYKPEVVKHTVTVVTDINCPYCRRLHDEMDQYLKLGVRVRYIFMPLKGKEDFKTTVSVWCSKDRNLSLDIAKAGGTLDPKTCTNPIKRQLDVARKIGVRGTPAIILEDGTMLPGYVPIDKLIAEIRKI